MSRTTLSRSCCLILLSTVLAIAGVADCAADSGNGKHSGKQRDSQTSQQQRDHGNKQRNDRSSQEQRDYDNQQRNSRNSQEQRDYDDQQRNNLNSQQQRDYGNQQRNSRNSQQQRDYDNQQQPGISARDAASRAQSHYGGRVLNVEPSGSGYRVRLLQDNSRVVDVRVED